MTWWLERDTARLFIDLLQLLITKGRFHRMSSCWTLNFFFIACSWALGPFLFYIYFPSYKVACRLVRMPTILFLNAGAAQNTVKRK